MNDRITDAYIGSLDAILAMPGVSSKAKQIAIEALNDMRKRITEAGSDRLAI